MRQRRELDTSDKLKMGIALLIILLIVLVVITTSLVYSVIKVESNIFRTGSVSINLNDGKPIVEDGEINFAPGMSMQKDFFIENNSTTSVYYKLYFSNLDGDLADVLIISIYNGEQLLYEGTAIELTKDRVIAADDEIRINETRELTIVFTYPENAGNVEEPVLMFDLCADAVQSKNNPNRLFD